MGAKYVIDEYTLKDIADSIREKTGNTLDIAPEDMSEEILSIRSAEDFYNEFWDNYQNNGDVYGCEALFGSEGWNDNNFKPKYSMSGFTRADRMFQTAKIKNIKKCLENAGVTFDFSKNLNFNYTFAYAKTEELPVIDMSKATNINCTFYYCQRLVSIDRLIVPDNGTFVSNSFGYCGSLVNLPVEGTISANGLDLQWSTKLSKESITSIINALSDTTSGLTVTFSEEAVYTAFDVFHDSSEWKGIRDSKPNWTISLV